MSEAKNGLGPEEQRILQQCTTAFESMKQVDLKELASTLTEEEIQSVKQLSDKVRAAGPAGIDIDLSSEWVKIATRAVIKIAREKLVPKVKESNEFAGMLLEQALNILEAIIGPVPTPSPT